MQIIGPEMFGVGRNCDGIDRLCLCLMIESLTSYAVCETLFYMHCMKYLGIMDVYGSFLANDVGED